MSEDTVRQIIESKLSSFWGVTTPISYDNVNYKPSRGVSFINCEIEGTGSNIKSFACTRDNYRLTIEVNTPIGDGTKSNNDFCVLLRDEFLFYQSGHLFCKNATIERVGDVEQFFRKQVIIDITYDNFT